MVHIECGSTMHSTYGEASPRCTRGAHQTAARHACAERRADMLFGFWFSGHSLTLRGGLKRYDHTGWGEKEGAHYEEYKIAHLKFSYNDQSVSEISEYEKQSWL